MVIFIDIIIIVRYNSNINRKGVCNVRFIFCGTSYRSVSYTHLIVKKAKERLELHQQKKEFGTNYIKTGFPELDEVIYGLEPGNELSTVAGRPNQGKTWILLKMLVEAWKQGKRVACLLYTSRCV